MPVLRLALLIAVALLARPAFAALVCPGASTLEGIDVSEFQGNIDWSQVKASGRAFAIARVSDGTGHPDPYFAQNWSGMKAAGLVRGVYQFFRPTQDPTAQANLLVNAIGALGPGDLPPVLDVEAADGASGAAITANIHTWVNVVQSRTGRAPIIYTGTWFWDPQVGSGDFTALPLWESYYCTNCCPNLPNPWGGFTLWQYSSTGSVPGVGGAVDLDKFNGTASDLQTLAAGAVCAAPPATAEATIKQPLAFDCGNSLVFYTSDWSGGSYKAECGNYQAMTGLSVSPSTGGAHAALCYNDDQAFFPHSYPTTCHAVVFNAGNAGYTGAQGDWDPNYYKGECAANEFVAGVSQTPSLQMSAILCCTGRVDHSAPAALVMAVGEAREGGTASTTGDWSGGYYKGECGPGRYVCGASQDPGQHKPHAILCCGTQTATGPALLSQTAAVDALTFDSQNQQRPPGAADFSPGMFKAECGSSQALTGLSASPVTNWAHSALCNASDPSFTHQSCHAVVFNAGNAGYTGAHGDWDPSYYKGECGANEYIAGASQTTDTHGLTAILCCAGNLTIDYPTCAALSVSGKNTIEAGATTGDWAGWYYKAECGPGRFAVGASQDPTSHNPHSILCCNPAATVDFGSVGGDFSSGSADLAAVAMPDAGSGAAEGPMPVTPPGVVGGCSYASPAPSGLSLLVAFLFLLLLRSFRRRAG